MNIWIFNHYAHPPDLPGGTRHYDLGRELVQLGHNVTIFATSFHHFTHRETRLGPSEKFKFEEVNGVKFVWVSTPPYQRNDWRRVQNMIAFAVRVLRLGRRIKRRAHGIRRPDVVIGSSPHLFTPLAAYLVSKKHQVPFIMEVRDLWPQSLIDLGGYSERHLLIKTLQALERFLYRQAQQIIVLGPQMKEYIDSYGIDQKKIIWIPSGVDISRFDDFSVHKSPGKVFNAMYLSAHGQANALDVLIQAAKIIKDQGIRTIRFVLVGDGPEKHGLITLARELGLDNVEFRDPVPKREVPKTLHEADATIFVLQDIPLYKYGISPNKLFDYLGARKPIVIAGRPASNPVENARCGLTAPPQDPTALADAIIRLYRMPLEDREAMGRRGREYVEKHHSIPLLAKRLERVLIHSLAINR